MISYVQECTKKDTCQHLIYDCRAELKDSHRYMSNHDVTCRLMIAIWKRYADNRNPYYSYIQIFTNGKMKSWLLRVWQSLCKLTTTCVRHRPSEGDIIRERKLLQLRVIYLFQIYCVFTFLRPFVFTFFISSIACTQNRVKWSTRQQSNTVPVLEDVCADTSTDGGYDSMCLNTRKTYQILTYSKNWQRNSSLLTQWIMMHDHSSLMESLIWLTSFQCVKRREKREKEERRWKRKWRETEMKRNDIKDDSFFEKMFQDPQNRQMN